MLVVFRDFKCGAGLTQRVYGGLIRNKIKKTVLRLWAGSEYYEHSAFPAVVVTQSLA